MKPVVPESRAEANAVVAAKDQPQYIPLPMNVCGEHIETKWQFTWRERLAVLFRGTMYLNILRHPCYICNARPMVTPVRPHVDRDDYIGGGTGCSLTRRERLRGKMNLAVLRCRAKCGWLWKVGIIKRTTAFRWEVDASLGERS